jgi:hypothetical protein
MVVVVSGYHMRRRRCAVARGKGDGQGGVMAGEGDR